MKSARTGSPQPGAGTKVVRPQQLNNPITRTPKVSNPKQKTVHLTIWVKPIVKAELQRIAEQEGLTVSKTGSAFLEQSLQNNIDLQYSTLLQPIIDSAIGKHMRSYSNRIAILLVRSLFASEQTRSLVTNILGRQPGVTPPVLEQVLTGSSNAAKRKITYLTPQLEQLVKEVKQWLEEGVKTNA